MPVLELLQVAVKSGDSVHKGTMPSLESLLESAKVMLRSQGAALIAESNHLPLLSSYSNDGTPLTTYHGIPLPKVSGRTTRRLGQFPVEVLVQNQFLRCSLQLNLLQD